MRKVWVIAAREYKAAVKTKSFVVGIVLLPLMMGGGFLAMYLFRDQVDLRPKRFAIVDHTAGGHFFQVLEKAAAERDQPQPASKQLESNKVESQQAQNPPTQAPFKLESVPAGKNLDELRLTLSERISKGELIGFLEIGPKILQPMKATHVPKGQQGDGGPDEPSGQAAQVEPHAPHALRYQTNRPGYQDFSKWAEKELNKAVHEQRAKKKGIGSAELGAIVQRVPLLTKGLTTRDPETGTIKEGHDQNPVVAFLLPGGLVVLMFMMVLLGAAPLLQGVMEEKMQRIAEVLLGSVQPFPLMLGKILGMACVSLTMASIYLAGAYWAVHSYGYGEYLSLEIIVWFLIFQALALFMFGSIYAAVGAACTNLQEAQAMLTPVSLISMIPLFIWVNIIKEPTSTFATGMSLFPLATPMLMVARQAVPPGIPLWQPILGVVLVLLTTLGCVYAAGRIFRVGILLQGKGARFRDLVRWVIRG